MAQIKKDFFWSGLCIAIIFGILFLFVFAKTTHAAIIFEDDFDSYAAGDLNGQGDWSGSSIVDVTVSDPNTAPNAASVSSGSGTVRNQFATSTSIYVSTELRSNNNTSAQGISVLFGNSADYNRIGFYYRGATANQLQTSSGISGIADSVNVGTPTTFEYHKVDFYLEYNGTAYEARFFIDGVLALSDTSDPVSPIDFTHISIAGSSAGGNAANARVDDVFVYDSDPTPFSGIVSINAPTNIIYAFNPIPLDIDYNQLDTYNYIVLDLQNITIGQNIFTQPISIPPVTNINLNYTNTFSLGLQGEYTLRARLWDSEKNLYTDWSPTTTFALGSTSTPPVDDYNVASSSFATSTAVDSGNLLSYVNVPQLLLEKAPFGYFFQVYSIVSNTVNNPPSASSFPIGSFEIQLAGATTTVEMFSTSTVSYFLTPSVVSPIRALLVAIVYMVTAISIYHIVRHAHLL